MHAIYREKFNAVDLCNRLNLGPDSIQYTIRTPVWYKRYFLAFLAISVGNAYSAYCATVRKVPFMDFKIALSEQLLFNPWLEDEAGNEDEDD